MGLTNSVSASSSSSAPILLPVSEELQSCLRCDGKGSSDPGNPGSFKDIHKKVKSLYPQYFEGAKLNINKILSNHFRVNHSMILSSVMPSGYKFGAFYEGTTMIGKRERYPSLSCTISPNGNQWVKFVHTLGCRYRLTVEAQIAESKYKACSTTLDYRSDNCTLSLGLDNLSLFDVDGTLVLHFLQAVSSGLALGVEAACHREAGEQRTILCGAARYSTGPLTISSTFGEAGIHVCCHRRASEHLQIGAELEINPRTQDSQGTIVYQQNVPQANLVFRGMMDSGGTVSGVLDKRLSTVLKSSLLISGALNHKKGHFRVGVGLNIG